jgi:hypothetical protein
MFPGKVNPSELAPATATTAQKGFIPAACPLCNTADVVVAAPFDPRDP